MNPNTAIKNENSKKTPTDTIEFEGKEYKWQRGSFQLPGDTTVYISKDVCNDFTIIKRLIDIDGQSILRELY